MRLDIYGVESRSQNPGARSQNSDFISWGLAFEFLLLNPDLQTLNSYFWILDSNSWLLNFTQRIELSRWIFASAAAVLIALLTVSIHTLKATRINPVKSLPYE